MKNDVISVFGLYLRVALPLGVASESSYSSLASNIVSKLFAYNYIVKNCSLSAFIWKCGKFLPKVLTYIYQQHGFSKQVTCLGSFGKIRHISVT
ncbi:MAG: hypothetical protein EZS28_022630 [Streblomastix strix]|uniref:Uncharacterized protein n=1 Tax=Streblomastix strix TaxID=222440 RepID=A0A5J4VH77_9EUKA|nr:MAG: hypothetical protein EZS28_022630 [Streblomastix strix]